MIETKAFQKNRSIFERNPKLTIIVFIVFLLGLFYFLFSVKFLNNAATEFEARSIKTVLLQKYYSKIIDTNIGRFIKLREHKTDVVRFERPTKNYMSHVAPTLERKYYKIAVDNNGFIMPSKIHERPDLSIVFLGGSTTECLYVDELKRFPYLVGRGLEHNLGKKVNSYNHGVSANDSLHSLNILTNKIIPMKPNYVVMMHNINDLVTLRSQQTYWHTESHKSPIQTSKNIFTRFEFPKVSKLNKTEQNYKDLFEKNLRLFILTARNYDIQPVLMTQANRIQDDDLYHEFNQIIRNVANDLNIKLIDLAKNIPAEEIYLYDRYHYTEKGSILAGKIIVDELKEIING